MPDNTLQIAITGEADGLNSALDEARGSVEAFMGPVGDLAELLELLEKAFAAIEAIGKLGALALGTENVTKLDTAFSELGSTVGAAFKPALDIVIGGLTDLVQSFNNALKGPSLLHDGLTELVLVVWTGWQRS